MLREIPLALSIIVGAVLIVVTQAIRSVRHVLRVSLVQPSYYPRRGAEALAASKHVLFALARGACQALVVVLENSIERVLCNDRAIRSLYLKRAMDAATSYEAWLAAARQREDLTGATAWREDPFDGSFDAALVRKRLQAMQALRGAGDVAGMVALLRTGLHRSIGGIDNPELYSVSEVGTKSLISAYNDETVAALEFVLHADARQLSERERFAFFLEARQAFGRSALLLSGGGRFGVYHTGVLKELFDRNLLPTVIAGASVGAMAACVCGCYTDEEARVLQPEDKLDLDIFEGLEQLPRMAMRYATTGVAMDTAKLETAMRTNLGNMTFLEAFRKSGRIINVIVTGAANHQPPRLLNHITAPSVLLRSAAMASCAIPGVFDTVRLLCKQADGTIMPWLEDGHRFSDGSLLMDLPTQRLAEMFHANHFLVSQVNPHVVPILALWTVRGFYNNIKYLITSEVAHRIAQLRKLALIPSFLLPLVGLIEQRYEGHVTILPPLGAGDYCKIVSNPTRDEVVLGTVLGRRATWPKLAYIRETCKVELALQRGLAVMRARLGVTDERDT